MKKGNVPSEDTPRRHEAGTTGAYPDKDGGKERESMKEIESRLGLCETLVLYGVAVRRGA